MSRSWSLGGLSSEALVDRFDEHLRRPRSGVRSVSPRVSSYRRRCLNLFERLPFRDQIADSIADDRHHVPVLDDVELIADAAMAGNYKGPGLPGNERNRWNRQLDEAVQSIDLALNAPASLDVDEREARGVENIAGNDDV